MAAQVAKESRVRAGSTDACKVFEAIAEILQLRRAT